MERQVLSFIVFVLLAALVPVIILSGPDRWQKVTAVLRGEQPTDPSSSAAPARTTNPTSSPAAPSAAEPAAAVATSLAWEELFRFDWTAEGIARRFPRVSVGLGYLHWQGYRVPVVTGTRPEDLAGSLTYYFNNRGQVEMIEFVGTTGAAGRIVSFCRQNFGLAQRITNSPSVFYYEKPHPSSRQTSVLVLRPAPVLEAADPYQRFQVYLRLFRDPEQVAQWPGQPPLLQALGYQAGPSG
jgi:hypothetical protein